MNMLFVHNQYNVSKILFPKKFGIPTTISETTFLSATECACKPQGNLEDLYMRIRVQFCSLSLFLINMPFSNDDRSVVCLVTFVIS